MVKEDGITTFVSGGVKPNKNIVKLPRVFKQMIDYEYNVKISTEKYEECKRRLHEEMAMETDTIQQTGESLFRMKQLISDTAYARFRYAIFPQVIENKGLNRILAKADESLNSYDLLEGLSYVTTDVNRSMKELITYIRENKETEKAVTNLTYEEIIKAYPKLAEKFAEFMQKYGNRSDFNCYCFVSKSWKDDPERFLGTLRTVLRSTDVGILTKEESEQKFVGLMERIKSTMKDKSYSKFEKRVHAVRYYHLGRFYNSVKDVF